MDKLFIDVTGDSASYDFPVDENGVWTGAWKTADEIQYNAPALAVDFDHLLKLEDPSAPKKKLRFGGASSVGDMDEFSTGGATRVEGDELTNRPNIFGETDSQQETQASGESSLQDGNSSSEHDSDKETGDGSDLEPAPKEPAEDLPPPEHSGEEPPTGEVLDVEEDEESSEGSVTGL